MSWVEQELQREEKRSDTFDALCKRMLNVEAVPCGQCTDSVDGTAP